MSQILKTIEAIESINSVIDPSVGPYAIDEPDWHIDTVDLKALAESYRRLLTAARNGLRAAYDATSLAGQDEYTEELERIGPILDALAVAIAEGER